MPTSSCRRRRLLHLLVGRPVLGIMGVFQKNVNKKISTLEYETVQQRHVRFCGCFFFGFGGLYLLRHVQAAATKIV